MVHKCDIRFRDLEVPLIGLGTWLLSGEECVRTVQTALSLGYRHIDTAPIYGNEKEIGKAVRFSEIPRDELFIVTKIPPSNFRFDDAIRSVGESLDDLGTGYVDLILMHWPDRDVPVEDTVRAMNSLRINGMTRAIGLSNFPPRLIDDASKFGDIFCNQIEYHPYLSRDKLILHSKKSDYLLTAYCPLAKGRVLWDETIKKIGAKYSKTPAQVTLRWIIQQGICAIPKSSNKERLRENIDIFDFELDNEEIDIISSLNRGLHLDPVSHLSVE